MWLRYLDNKFFLNFKLKTVELSYKSASTYSVLVFQVFVAGERPGAPAVRCIVHSLGSVTEFLLTEGPKLYVVPISESFLLSTLQP